MARGQRSVVDDSTELLTGENDGVMDWSHLTTGSQPIEVVDRREVKQEAMEAFMNEPLVIQIHSTTDEREPAVAEIGVNGQRIAIPREVKVRIPRKFVEVLARSQPVAWRTVNVPDPTAMIGTVPKRTTGQSFPFSVLHDPSPLGRRWLERVMAEG